MTTGGVLELRSTSNQGVRSQGLPLMKKLSRSVAMLSFTDRRLFEVMACLRSENCRAEGLARKQQQSTAFVAPASIWRDPPGYGKFTT